MIVSYLRNERHEILRAIEQVYDSIAVRDMASPIQNLSELTRRAFEDVQRIGSVQNLSVLEIGPGRGIFLKLLRSLGAIVSAADLSLHYLSNIDHADSTNFVLDIQDSGGVPVNLAKKFDLIVMTDVLEHLLLPADALLNCHEMLKDGGRLYVRVPAHESLIQYSQRLGCPYPLVHVRTFTRSLLLRELRAAGFREIAGPASFASSPRVPRAAIGSIDYWSRIRSDLRYQLDGRVMVESTISFSRRLQSALLSGGDNVSNHLLQRVLRGLSKPFTNSSELYCLASKCGLEA